MPGFQTITSVPESFDEYDFFERYGMKILTSLRRIIRAVDIHSRKLRDEYNVTTPQMICLYALVRRGSIMHSELAREVNLSVSTVNGIVDRLEAKGLLRRNRSTKDRRKVYVEVTEAGLALTRHAPSPLQDGFSEALRKLPELEQAAIALSLDRVVKLMGVGELDASPNLVPNGQLSEPYKKERT